LLAGRIFSILVALALIASVGQQASFSQGLPPLPPDYLQPERVWIKEEGFPASTWGQYNETTRNKLNLTYRHSKVNIAYVIRSADPTDKVNATFIVYRNTSGSDGFNSTGQLFPGSVPCWTLTISLSSKQTVGQYAYHLFMATFDPHGVPAIYQVRINLTGTLSGGSNWSKPNGNPNVPWVFFEVFAGGWDPISVVDQLGRASPFFLEAAIPIPSTSFTATVLIEPMGNDTGASTARVRWNRTDGTTIATYYAPIFYVGDGKWKAQSTIPANASAFPANYTHSYVVDAEVGLYTHSAPFYVYPVYAALVPDTWITEGPPATVENGTVHFSWIGSDLDGSVAGYDYRMDTAPWIFTTNTSKTFTGLSNGTHRFEVAAQDEDGISDPAPDYKDFTVLLNSPPETVIATAPNATTRQRDATFVWRGSDVDGHVVSYQCQLDGSPWVTTAATSATYLNLSSGSHTFSVKSKDNKGLEDPTPAQVAFTILPSWCEEELERLNGQVAQLGQRISELEERVANLTLLLLQALQSNLNLSARITLLEAERAQLSTTIDYLRQERSQLLDQVSSLSQEKAALLDSLGTYLNLTLSLQSQIELLKSQLAYLNQTAGRLELEKQELERLSEELTQKLAQCQSQIPEMVPVAGMTAFVGAGWVLSLVRRCLGRYAPRRESCPQ